MRPRRLVSFEDPVPASGRAGRLRLQLIGRLGRNPKLVAAELGHATSHMVVSNYDSFLDPRIWPEAEEIERLCSIYGWEAVEDRSTVAPHGHPSWRAAGRMPALATEARMTNTVRCYTAFHSVRAIQPRTSMA